jgi:predicted nucleotidyltransferase
MRMAREEREEILATLRRHAPELATRGVRGLLLFGSVARGEADPASDGCCRRRPRA